MTFKVPSNLHTPILSALLEPSLLQKPQHLYFSHTSSILHQVFKTYLSQFSHQIGVKWNTVIKKKKKKPQLGIKSFKSQWYHWKEYTLKQVTLISRSLGFLNCEMAVKFIQPHKVLLTIQDKAWESAL